MDLAGIECKGYKGTTAERVGIAEGEVICCIFVEQGVMEKARGGLPSGGFISRRVAFGWGFIL